MDLRSKLQLYRETAGETVEKASAARMGRGSRDIDVLVPGRVLENEHGCCYLIENRYPPTCIYGGQSLGDALDAGKDALALLGGPGCAGLRPDRAVFLDTETTGLSGGAGTAVFLAGAGFFENGVFTVRQYFMRDYDEEAAMLYELQKFFAEREWFITFNGKAFDVNLLQGRFISNRFKPFFAGYPNLDLLYPARKVWRLKLESCRLSSLEENVLGESRQDDIPGALIPSVYFKYLEDRDAGEIRRVVKHNELDILSMVSLLARLSSMLRDPLAKTDGGLELLGMSRLFESDGKTDNMVECLEACTASGRPDIRMHAVKRLTGVYKRSGRYDRALEHWKAVEADEPGFEYFHLVEMAKYYEHKAKDYEMALQAVEKAMRVCARAGTTGGGQMDELRRRRDRLRIKAGKRQV